MGGLSVVATKAHCCRGYAMMIRLSDVKISTKIGLACIVPLLGLALFAGVSVLDAWGRTRAAGAVLAGAELAEQASLVVHELQRERGMSAGFIGSNGKDFAGEMPAQRKASDGRIGALHQAAGAARHGGTLGARLESAAAELKALDKLRRDVDAFALPGAQAAAAYTNIITVLIGTVEAISELAQDSTIASALSVYTAGIRGKELAGQERASGARGFAAGQFGAADLRGYVALGAAQDVYFELVRRQGSPAQQDALKAALASPASADVARMREVAVRSAVGEVKSDVTAPVWFRASTARIDELKKVEDRFAADLKGVAGAVAGQATSALMLALAAAVGLIAIASFTAFVAARSITRPLGNLVDTTLTLAGGDTGVEIAGGDRKDEIGGMARAVVVFRDNAIERMRLEDAARAEQEQREARQRRIDSLIGQFRTSVSATLAGVGDNAVRMDGTAKSLSGVATEASAQATGAAAASEECSANVQNVASAAEELTSSIKEIGHQVENATGVVRKAADLARNSNNEIEALAGAAQKIGDVVGLIQAIAAQTNLLALNATIEAARAGEAGRGFAVVASEVKSLATQTAKATEEIGQQIAAIQDSTSKSVASVRTITATMQEVDGFTSAIAAAVEEQGAATEEISRNVQMAARGTDDLSQNVSGVTGAIRETSRAAEEVLDASGKLGSHANALKGEVDRFLAEVAAA
jgi:methyl-accepting chemotaxis protein